MLSHSSVTHIVGLPNPHKWIGVQTAVRPRITYGAGFEHCDKLSTGLSKGGRRVSCGALYYPFILRQAQHERVVQCSLVLGDSTGACPPPQGTRCSVRNRLFLRFPLPSGGQRFQTCATVLPINPIFAVARRLAPRLLACNPMSGTACFLHRHVGSGGKP